MSEGNGWCSSISSSSSSRSKWQTKQTTVNAHHTNDLLTNVYIQITALSCDVIHTEQSLNLCQSIDLQFVRVHSMQRHRNESTLLYNMSCHFQFFPDRETIGAYLCYRSLSSQWCGPAVQQHKAYISYSIINTLLHVNTIVSVPGFNKELVVVLQVYMFGILSW